MADAGVRCSTSAGHRTEERRYSVAVDAQPRAARQPVFRCGTLRRRDRVREALKRPQRRQRAHRSRRLLLLPESARQGARAVRQSLGLDPDHVKTLLNLGIVRAFGKQDLDGATLAWQKVLKLSPDSPEGQAAKRALDTVQSAHPGAGAQKTGG